MFKFIRVGDQIFNIDNINAVNLDTSDGYVNIFMSDNTEGDGYVSKGYQLNVAEPATQAFIAWISEHSFNVE